VVIVSASPEAYVGAAGHRLGADGVIATRLEVAADGRLTGHYDGRNCRGEEKLRRLRRWVDESGIAPETVWAYGNSRGDLRMLRAADVGVNVGRLGRLGRLGSFQTLGHTPPDGAGR
jgi:phosphatidylglycerophosphatase C